jgi:hypothetical protein
VSIIRTRNPGVQSKLSALNGPTGRQNEHDDTTIAKDRESFFVNVVVVVVFVKAVGALILTSHAIR